MSPAAQRLGEGRAFDLRVAQIFNLPYRWLAACCPIVLSGG